MIDNYDSGRQQSSESDREMDKYKFNHPDLPDVVVEDVPVGDNQDVDPFEY